MIWTLLCAEESSRAETLSRIIGTCFDINVGRSDLDRPCGLMVRVLGYRSEGPGSIPGTTRNKNVVGLERGAPSLVSTN
jgi:hypothetical protein